MLVRIRTAVDTSQKCLTLFGSMVQKGKFSAGMPILLSVLKSVLLPTLGKPTIPTCAPKKLQQSRSLCGSLDQLAKTSWLGSLDQLVAFQSQTFKLFRKRPRDWPLLRSFVLLFGRHFACKALGQNQTAGGSLLSRKEWIVFDGSTGHNPVSPRLYLFAQPLRSLHASRV